MADGAWRGIALSTSAHFAAAMRGGGLAPFQSCAETGNRATGERVYLKAMYSRRTAPIHVMGACRCGGRRLGVDAEDTAKSRSCSLKQF